MIKIPPPDFIGKGTSVLIAATFIYWFLGPLWLALILMIFGWFILAYLGKI